MARKEFYFTINDRGTELNFKVVEMSATQLEEWLIRAMMLLSGGLGKAINGTAAAGNPDTPNGTGTANAADKSEFLARDLGKAGKLFSSCNFTMLCNLLAGLEYEKVKPLMDSLLACCYRVLPDTSISHQVTANTADGFIQDYQTLLKLRTKALEVNFDFFATAGASSSQEASE